jgi:hypothetical protein
MVNRGASLRIAIGVGIAVVAAGVAVAAGSLSSCSGSDSELCSSEGILANEKIYSPSGDVDFGIVCNGGTFPYCKLIERKDNVLCWSQTVPWGSYRLWMTDDGNLLVLDQNWNALWATNTGGNSNGYLKVQDDGNVVVYSESDDNLWDTYGQLTPWCPI